MEPGCYFIDYLLDQALDDDKQKIYFNTDRLKEFRGFGGVRLEDDVRIISDGCENLTVCPRAVDEILDVMKGGAWPREYSLCSLFILKGNDDTKSTSNCSLNIYVEN